MLHQNRTNASFIDKFIFARRAIKDADGQTTATSLQLQDLLRLCLYSLEAPVIVLDGVDECENNPEIIKFVKSIRDSSVKILLLSRLNVVPLTRFVPHHRRLCFSQQAVDHDIRLFSKKNLLELQDDGLLREETDIDGLVDRLVLGANRMFLWAKLMVLSISSPAYSATQREQAINAIEHPEGLDSLYERILTRISLSQTRERLLAARIIKWVTFDRRVVAQPLLSRDWYTLCGLGNEDSLVDVNKDIPRLVELVSIITFGLVELGPATSCTVGSEVSPSIADHSLELLSCDFIHLSVRQYLRIWVRSSSTSHARACIQPQDFIGNTEIAKECLDILLRTTPSSRPRNMHPDVYPNEFREGNLLSYCGMHWITHLDSATRPQQHHHAAHGEDELTAVTELCDALEMFLDRPLAVAHWMQAFCSTRVLSRDRIVPGDGSIATHLACVFSWFDHAQTLAHQHPTISDRIQRLRVSLQKLHSDLKTISAEWTSKLFDKPWLVWGDLLLFTSSSFLPKADDMDTIVLCPKPSSKKAMSSRKLCCISTTSPDGQIVGVLSVWPSNKFEQFWEHVDPESAYEMVESFCEGWHAAYEVNYIEQGQSSVGSVEIPLVASEVALQMRQAFRQADSTSWKASFPLTISPDGRSVCILRTVYRVLWEVGNATNSSPKLRLRSHTLDLSGITTLEEHWDESLARFDPSAFLRQKMPPTLQLLHRPTYTYRIEFNANASLLLFFDSKLRSTDPSHVVVFALSYIAEDDSLYGKKLGHGIMPLHQDLMLAPSSRIIKTARFLPRNDAILLASACKLMIWHFLKGQSSLLFLFAHLDRG